jgi:hypothetical protein
VQSGAGRPARFRVGDKVREGMHVGTVTDVGTVLIQVKTTMGASRMVCPWELVRLPASRDGHISDSAADVKPLAVQNVEETDLAWALTDAAAHRLNSYERTVVFVRVGAGDTFAAIRTLLKLITAKRIPLTPELVQLCTRWLDAYASHPEQEHLRGLIETISMPDTIQASTAISRPATRSTRGEAIALTSQFCTRRVPVERPNACRAASR